MSIIEIVLGIILIILAIAVTLVVLFQEGHEKASGGGVITGPAEETFFTKNKSRSIDTFLEKWTKLIALGFISTVIIVNIILYFNIIG